MPVVLRTRKLKNGGKSYYLDISHNGDRWREFLNAKIKKSNSKVTNKEIKRIAQIMQQQRELELTRDGKGIRDLKREKMSFTDYFERYAKNYKKADIRKINSSLKKFKEFSRRITFKQLDKKKCTEFLQFLQDHENMNSHDSVVSYFGVLRKVVNSAIDDGIMASSPLKRIQVKRTRPQLHKHVLTDEELQKLNDAHCGNSEVKRAFMFCCNTGLGLAECRELTWEKLKDNKLSHTSRAKSSTPLTIDLNENAKYYLGEKGSNKEKVFTLPSHSAFNKALKPWAKRAKVDKHLTSYVGRHTFATNLIKAGVNPKVVAKLLGHTSLKHIDKYINHVDELKKEAVDSLPTIKHLKKVV